MTAGGVLRIAISAGVLAALVMVLDTRALIDRMSALEARWAALALALSVPQVVLLAWRWRLTAGRLGIHLPFSVAVREYYVAVFLNQVLPGGVMGDVSRAWRHARGRAVADAGAAPPGLGPAARAVILERASSQMVMGAVAALSLVSLPLAWGGAPKVATAAAAGALGAVVLVLVLSRRARAARGAGAASSVWRDIHAAVLARDVIGVQLATSALAVGSYLAMYVMAARAVGVDTPVASLLPLVAPVLVSMLIPATVAGWGVREATAAALWSAVGLTAVDGVAISAAYGLLVLLASLPGALVLLSVGRDRTGGPRPDGSGGSEGGAPARESRSAAA